jgi:4,5:9,10-diseco-3-hydroxy-5,9,17-trioxoandrosta-1(10),2-diene-4-oate hydrolase
MEDRYAMVQGYKTRFWAEGSGDPLLLVHGLGSSAESWMFNVEGLAKDYRVLAPDLVGFGKTEKTTDPHELTLTRAARFLSGFLETQGVSQAHVVGNSMGGIVSLQFAVDYPQMVNKLVLVDPAGFGREVHVSYRLQSLPLVGEMLAEPSRRGVRMSLQTAAKKHGFITDDLIEQFYQLSRQPGMKAPFLAAVRQGIALSGVKNSLLDPLQERIPQITAPTMIMWGRHDCVLPITQIETGKRLMPHARVHVFEDCGHIPQMENPEEFNRLLHEFLESA